MDRVLWFCLVIMLVGCSSTPPPVVQKPQVAVTKAKPKIQYRQRERFARIGGSAVGSATVLQELVNSESNSMGGLSQADIDPIERQSAESYLRQINTLITQLNALHSTRGADAWEYAKDYQECQSIVNYLATSQNKFEEVIRPSLLPMPPTPTDRAYTEYRQILEKEKERLAEEKFREDQLRQAEKQHQENMVVNKKALEAQQLETAAEVDQAYSQREQAEAQKQQVEATVGIVKEVRVNNAIQNNISNDINSIKNGY
jgi:alpha-galactosidase/6-phospho-beta-glucosidase family protein